MARAAPPPSRKEREYRRTGLRQRRASSIYRRRKRLARSLPRQKTSQPPKYYTEGTLLRAMETAGRTVDDEELRDAMKENGIGRPSTRAAIIETLFARRYIYRERKNILATQAGIDLIATIQEELLKSAKLTGLWENKLRRIERGEYSPDISWPR